jgi:hypothetical protein
MTDDEAWQLAHLTPAWFHSYAKKMADIGVGVVYDPKKNVVFAIPHDAKVAKTGYLRIDCDSMDSEIVFLPTHNPYCNH